MKKFVLVVLLGLSCFSFIGCFQRDDDEYFLRQFKLTDAFVFDNKKEYVVGDTIFFDVNFSRYIKEEGYSNLLDIYETTGAEVFNYSFNFSRYSEFSDRYESLQIAEKYVFAEKGKFLGRYNDVDAILNDEQTHYESRIGIVLAETGVFRLGNSFMLYPNVISENHVSITIEHRLDDETSNLFEFTVTE